MKRNDIKALHSKTQDQLQKQLDELLIQLAKLRLEKKAGKLENPSLVKHVADDIARVETVMTEKKSAAPATDTKKESKEVKSVRELVGKKSA